MLDIGLKLTFYDTVETIIVALVVSILLLQKRRAAFAVYMINVGFFILFSADKIMHLGDGRYSLEVKEVMFGLIFGTMQVGFIAWGLWAICKQEEIRS